MSKGRKLAAVAIGGNSLITDKTKAAMPHQWDAVRETCTHIADMVAGGWDLVITHGNGPQVGFILRRSELAAGEVHTVPLDIIGADTQGSIGYMLQQALDNEFHRRGIDKRAVAVVTQVLVDRDDPAFETPTKPIGGFMEEGRAREFEQEGWSVVEDAGRGWRRVVASPIPQQIMEVDVVRSLLGQGFVVVSVGGGGIPVVQNDSGELRGTYAVIDKDRATALLAASIDADLMVISTAVEKVALNYNQPDQRDLDRMSVTEARRYMEEGHFAPGSMLPKIEAVLSFVDRKERTALITDPPNIKRALDRATGTWIEYE
jgi:carbamate kinase